MRPVHCWTTDPKPRAHSIPCDCTFTCARVPPDPCHGCNGPGFHKVTCKTAVKESANGLPLMPERVAEHHLNQHIPCPECLRLIVQGEWHKCEPVASAAAFDPVERPSHYASGSIECIDAIESALTPEEFRGYCKGQVLKYTWRGGKKDDAQQDARKAEWYAKRLIDALDP